MEKKGLYDLYAFKCFKWRRKSCIIYTYSNDLNGEERLVLSARIQIISMAKKGLYYLHVFE